MPFVMTGFSAISFQWMPSGEPSANRPGLDERDGLVFFVGLGGGVFVEERREAMCAGAVPDDVVFLRAIELI